MRIVILMLFYTSLYLYAQGGWIIQNSGTNLDLRACFFIDVNTGYAVGGNTLLHNNQVILKTTNSGTNWFMQNSTDTNYLYDICFVDNNTGIAVGWNRTILRTTNGGSNWSINFSGGLYLKSVSFADANYGNAVGNGVILRTTNGGLTWFYQYNSSGKGSEIYYSVYLLSNTVGIATSFNSLFTNYIRRTVNGGTNWPSVALQTGYLYDISFVNSITGIIVGENGRVYKTTNSGVNWVFQSLNVSNSLLGVHLTSSSGYIVGSSGIILKTTDSGTTWNQQYSGIGSTLFSVYFINNTTGFCVGANGTILRTTNGGGPFLNIQPVSSEIPKSYSLLQNYPNPFNPITAIKFDVHKSGLVKIIIFDLLGREITQLINQQLKAGSYSADWDASNYPSGVYFYSLSTEDFTQTKKMVLVK